MTGKVTRDTIRDDAGASLTTAARESAFLPGDAGTFWVERLSEHPF